LAVGNILPAPFLSTPYHKGYRASMDKDGAGGKFFCKR